MKGREIWKVRLLLLQCRFRAWKSVFYGTYASCFPIFDAVNMLNYGWTQDSTTDVKSFLENDFIYF